jgi:hypothetical protein
MIGTVNSLTNASGAVYGGLYGFKNRIINGAMAINQRVGTTSQTITGGASPLAFNCDRWQVRSQGANASVQQVATNNIYRMVFTGLSSNTGVAASQSIEALNCADLAGHPVTISLLASSTSLTSLTLELYYANTTDTFGTWGSPTVTSIGSQAVTISSTESLVSWTVTVPSAATTGLQLRITSGALLATQTLSITNVQLEKGSTATSFDYLDYGRQLQLCMRYCQFNQSGAGKWDPGGVQFAGSVPVVVPMRTTPSVTVISSASALDQLYGGRRNITGTPTFYDVITTSVGFTSGQAYVDTVASTANAEGLFIANKWFLIAEL